MKTTPTLYALTLSLAVLAVAGPGATQGTADRGEPDGGDTILPGYWSYNYKTLLVVDKSERRCIKKHDIEKVMRGAINRHYTCEYPAREQSFGRVSMKGVCRDKKGRELPMSMSGQYTPTTLDMTVRVIGIPVQVHGRRLSATCPAGGES